MSMQMMKNKKKAIIETAARLIKSDVKSTVPSITDQYPGVNSLDLSNALSFVPQTLQAFLSCLFVGEDKNRKVASIGQAIIQSVRPRAVVVPLQIGLAVQMHHLYRS